MPRLKEALPKNNGMGLNGDFARIWQASNERWCDKVTLLGVEKF
jgi:hypothetical protein